MANGYLHEFNCLKLRRLATFIVNRRRTNLPVSSEPLHDSKIRTGLEQIGHEASPEVMAREAFHIRCRSSFQQDLGYPFARKAFGNKTT